MSVGRLKMYSNRPLLQVTNLKKYFSVKKSFFSKTQNYIKAVDGIGIQIYAGETFGLVGESGCGKTTACKAILRAIEPTCGEIYFHGINLRELSKKKLRELRERIQLVYQDPYSSLDPRKTVGSIIAEPLIAHKLAKRSNVKSKVEEMLLKVGMPAESTKRYPHEFSGGQRQRIGIARSLVLNPDLVVLDEPVSALDVSIQAQIINLLSDLQKEFNYSYLLISHDLSLMRYICDRVAVMYLGRIVEQAPSRELFVEPKHPYTKALISATPEPDPRVQKNRIILEGDVPSPMSPPSGCRFHTRCPEKMPLCSEKEPPDIKLNEKHVVTCHLFSENKDK